MTTRGCGWRSCASIPSSRHGNGPELKRSGLFRIAMTILRISFLLVWGVQWAVSQQLPIVVPETRFDWGEVFSDDSPEHAFTIQNARNALVTIRRVDLTPPLTIKSMPSVIAPQQQGTVVLHLDTTKLLGRYNGTAIVRFASPEIDDAEFSVAANVIGRIEVSPLPAFFVAGQRGKITEQSLDIINHESVPVLIRAIEHPTDNFTTKLKTVDPG